jgi:ADP-heptose:LPS heptosyltransferase
MNRALIIQLTRFGDLVQTKRLVLTLQKRGFEVHICIDRSLKDLAAILYPQAVIHPVAAHGTGISGTGLKNIFPVNLEAFGKLKEIQFSEVYNLNYSSMNYALSTMFDPKIVRGHKMVNGQALKSPWFDFAFRIAADRRNNINLVDYLAALSPDMIKPDDVNPVAGAKGGGIGVVLAGRESRRSLPFDVLIPLILSAQSTVECKKIYLLGSGAEKDAGRKLLSHLPARAAQQTENIAGKTDWKSLTEVVRGLDMLLTPDTGTMHLAAHLGVPVTGFFLSSAWCTETGPYGEGHSIIQADTDCSPCIESRPCYNDLKCLEPFKDRGLSRFLVTRKPEHLPEGLLLFESKYDFLGTSYVSNPENSSKSITRERMRDFIGCHLGLLDIGQFGPFADLAEQFYKEKDWITPLNKVNYNFS